MFGKKKCSNCGRKTEKGYDFCPYCGSETKKKDGLLDEIDENMMERDMMKGFGFNFNNSLFSKLVNKVAKDLEKQFQNANKTNFREINSKNPNIVSRGLSISISSNGSEPVIKVRNLGDAGNMNFGEMPKKQESENKQIKHMKFTKEQKNKLEKLPKVEPQTMVRRLSNKVVYEIDIPGAKKEDVIIQKFKNSIEIKAFAKDKVFIKIIPVGLPILRYSLDKGKLNLELKPEM